MTRTFTFLLLGLAAACGGGSSGAPGSDGGGSQTASAQLRIWVTDAPFPFEFVESASVVIREVRVHSDAGGWNVVFTGTREIDLVPLTNGIEVLLVDAQVEPGTYNEVRLIVDAGEVVLGPEAVVEDGDPVYDTDNGRLFFPSGSQSGIKVKIENDIVVTTQLSADLVLDFDLARNFVFNGPATHAPGVKRVLFTPVVRATDASTAGSIAVTVLSDNLSPEDAQDDFALEGATVRVLDGGTEIATVGTDADGRAVVSVPPGTYDIEIEATGHASTTLPAVQVTLANLTDPGPVVLGGE